LILGSVKFFLLLTSNTGKKKKKVFDSAAQS